MNSPIAGGGVPSTPWWQQAGPAKDYRLANFNQNAPEGYQYDQVKGDYVPIVGSAADSKTQRSRAQGIEDTGNRQEQQGFGNQQDLFARLIGAVGGVNSGAGGAAGGASVGGASVGGGADMGYGVGGGSMGGPGGAGSASGGGSPSISLSALRMPEPTHVTPSWQSITGPAQATADAEESATFGKVKDNAANTATAAQRGLTDSLAARGMTGGGYEGGQIGATLGREANTIGEGVRQWAGQRYTDANHRADVNTGAGIAARGQDIGAQTAERGQDIGATVTGRGQDLSAAEAGLNAGTQRYGIDQGNATTQRGQTLQAGTAANALAEQKRQSLQGMLMSAMGGLSRSNPSLIY